MRTTAHPRRGNKDKNTALNHEHKNQTVLRQFKRKLELLKLRTRRSGSCRRGSYHEERHGAPSVDGAVLDVGLVGQVVRRLDGNLHPLDGQEGRQVGRVGGDDDQGERPPARWRRTKVEVYGRMGHYVEFLDLKIDILIKQISWKINSRTFQGSSNQSRIRVLGKPGTGCLILLAGKSDEAVLTMKQYS